MKSIFKILLLASLLFVISCDNRTPELEPPSRVVILEQELLDKEAELQELRDEISIKETLEAADEFEIEPEDNEPASSLDYIKQYKNKYPRSVTLFENVALKSRMKILLGSSNYNLFIKNTSVENPIEIANNKAFIPSARSSSFGTYEAVLFIDFVDNEITVGILNETEVLLFSENEDKTKSNIRNQSLKNWFAEAQENARSN